MDDKFLVASQEYLQRRHDIALRLLAECDKQAAGIDTSEENQLRDGAMLALVKRDYLAAAEITKRLAVWHEKREHISQRMSQLRKECDRLCSARATLEQRQELLELAPAAIEDPYIGGVGAYLNKRHETALRLGAALDAKVKSLDEAGDSAQAAEFRLKREHMGIEIDTLLAALQVHEEREELLGSAEDALGDSVPGTEAYLRRVLAYLDARSAIVLRLIANIDSQLSAKGGGADAEGHSHLRGQRAELMVELDQINEKIATQKRGEAELRAVGLKSDASDPYHMKVTTYLQNRSDVALQLIAFLDARLDSLSNTPEQSEERGRLLQQRDKLRAGADETLAQIADQEQGQALMDSLGVPARAAPVA